MLWVLGASRISDFFGISASRSGGESGKGLGGSLGRTCEQVKVLHQGAEPTAGETAREGDLWKGCLWLALKCSGSWTWWSL